MKITNSKSSKPSTGSVTVSFNSKVKSTRFDGKTLTIKVSELKNTGLYNFRLVLRSLMRTAQGHGIKHLAVDFNEVYELATQAHVSSDMAKVTGEELNEVDIAEMLGYELELANYNFNDYKQKSKEGFAEVKEVLVFNIANSKLTKAINIGQGIAVLTNESRTVSNTPAQEMTPKKMARVAIAGAKKVGGVKVKVLNRKQMQAQKMGAILGVAQGAASEPQLIILEYKGSKSKNEKPLVIIGKAITYDTGGLGIKPAEGMVDMHLDMSAGSITMHALFAIAKLGIKRDVVAIIPATENAVGSKSYRNGDILKSMSGKTIEVRHTDAEGRLVLADSITYAQKHYKPSAIIDLATLTGAAIMAIGQHASLIMTNSCKSKLPKIARKCGAETGNRVWQMPVWDVYKTHMKSKVADISNLSSNRWGGAITAAAFLSEFLDDGQDWMHIDIAPRMESVDGDNLAHGATGEPVYLLTKLADRV